MQTKRKSGLLIQALISLIIVIVLFYYLDIESFTRQFQKLSFSVFVFIIVLLIPSVLLRSLRWKILFENAHHNITLVDSTNLMLVGMSLNLILPASFGDIAKSYFGYRWSGIKEHMLSVSLLDKVIALGSLAALGIPCALYRGNLSYAFLSIFVLIPAIFVLILPHLTARIHFVQRLFAWFTKVTGDKFDFSAALKQSGITKAKLLYAFLLSVCGWALTYLQMYFCFRAIGSAVPLFYVLAVAPLITLVRLFPFTLSGIGSDEAVLCYFFTQTGTSMEEILVGALIYRFLTLILPGLIGLLPLIFTKRMDVINKQG
ncbi:MAG: lysylphosphatidylglycerol synthase transmembrane domain-containing protein [Phycisphaerae bacterium]|jgi:uncharacterized protein (TIRG00374 family)